MYGSGPNEAFHVKLLNNKKLIISDNDFVQFVYTSSLW